MAACRLTGARRSKKVGLVTKKRTAGRQPRQTRNATVTAIVPSPAFAGPTEG